MKKFVQHQAIILYFIAAYVIAWGTILFIFRHDGFKPFDGESVLSGSINPNYFIVWIVMLFAPAIAGISFISITDGKMGVVQLFSSIKKWKVNFKWYALALFVFPVVLLILFFSFSIFSPKFYPSTMIPLGLTAGLVGGFFEEIGWTGFALPKLQLLYRPFKAAIILGVVHTFWHLLADWWGGINFYKDLYALHFFLWILALTALRILIVWIFNNTGSLLLAQLTHASFTGSQLMFTPSVLNRTESIAWYLAFVIVLWVLVTAAFIAERSKKSTAAESRIKSISPLKKDVESFHATFD